MSELQPEVDLARTLADQCDLPKFPRRTPAYRGQRLTTIAGDGCWCGRPMDHDWVGREDGAPHPRYPD